MNAATLRNLTDDELISAVGLSTHPEVIELAQRFKETFGDQERIERLESDLEDALDRIDELERDHEYV